MESQRIFVIVLLAVGLTLVFADGDGASSERLYDTAAFQEYIGTKDHFVKFYAPWCGHCKRLAPVWDELSEKYNAPEDSKVTIAKVDCTEETKLCSDEGVTGYPTLKFYRSGEEALKYKGKRDFETLDGYVQEQLTPKAEVPQTPEAKNGLYELTTANFKDHVAKGSHFVKFYAPWCGHCKRLAPTWEELAEGFQHSDGVTIVKVDCTAHREVCETHGVKGYPTLKFFKQGEVVDTYKGARDHVALKEYVSRMSRSVEAEATPPAPKKEDTPPPPKKEEPAAAVPGDEPQASDSKVLVLTTDNFSGQIASGTTMVKFYAPWCGHCKKLAPTWDQLAEKFSQRAQVNVAKVDCTVEKELCKKHEIRGYPTLMLFQDGTQADKYSGARSLDSLETYLTAKIPKEEL